MFHLVFEAVEPAEQIQKFNKFPQNIDQHRMWKAWWQLCPPGYRTILWPPSVRQSSGPWLSWTLAAFCVARLASGSPARLTLPSHLVIWKSGTTGIDHFKLWPEEVYIRNQFGGSTHMRPAWRTCSGVTPASWHAILIPGTSSAPQTLAEAGIETWTPTFTSPFTWPPPTSLSQAGSSCERMEIAHLPLSSPFPPCALPTCCQEPGWRHHLQGFSTSPAQDHLCPAHPGGSQNSDFSPGLISPISPGAPSAPHMLDGHGMKNLPPGFSTIYPSAPHTPNNTCVSSDKQDTF